MSDTPRTGAVTCLLCHVRGVPIEFAQELERENAALREEVEQLKGVLALGQQNCDDAYNDLREERDEAKTENAALRLSLKTIAEANGFDNIGNWARNQARAAIDAARKEAKP